MGDIEPGAGGTRRRGRLAVAALVGAAALWASWWPVAAWLERRATQAWLEERRAAGWQAEAAAVEVSGFPMTYARRLVAPMLADPAAGWAWQAPELVVARPRHARIADLPTRIDWPARQTLRRPDAEAEITAGSLQAEIRGLRAPGGLTHAEMRGAAVGIAVRSGDETLLWQVDRLDLTAVAAEGDASRLDLTARLRATAVSDASGERLPGPERLDLDAAVAFDAAWDMAALTARRPQPREIALREAALDWGGLAMRVAGDLAIDAEGVPEGRLVVQATNWRDRLEAARASGQLPPAAADAIAAAADLASRLSGRPDRLDLPLVFEGGRVRLGLLPLGPAPRIVLP